MRFIAKLYWFLWYKVLQRRDPFTAQLCRMEEAWPYVFWALYLALAGVCYHGLFLAVDTWQAVLPLAGLLFLAWLAAHLVDYIQAHPENRPQRRRGRR